MTYNAVHRQIDEWYHKYGRLTLPWRNTLDPYHIYVSEVMLQQTQVKTVLDRFYHPFLTQFPSLEALAEAKIESVLKAWEGLGYYSRARNLHKAATLTAPALPDDFEELQALPGIGKNTAAAICAFAYRQPVPVMEANLKRVLSRFFGYEAPKDNDLWDAAFRLLNTTNSYDYNQAMMDIGSMVCLPKAPKCDLCPLQSECVGTHRPEQFGVKKSKKVPTRTKDIFVWRANDSLYLICRKERFLSGMYGFPEFNNEEINPNEIGARLIGNVSQKYSHFSLEAKIYITYNKNIASFTNGCWHKMCDITNLPMSEVDKKIIRLLKTYQQQANETLDVNVCI